MSAGGETIGVAEVQLRVGGAPGFDRAMAAAGASTVGLGRTIQATSQTSGQAWAKLFAPPPLARQKSLFGGGHQDVLGQHLLWHGEEAGPPRPREASPWDAMFGPKERGTANEAERAEEKLDKAQKETTLSGRAKAIVLSRMSGGLSELALSMNTATDRETAWRSALVASSSDMAGAISLVSVMTGGTYGLALGIGASVVPAFLRWALAMDDAKTKAAALATEVEELVGKFKTLQGVRESVREAAITTQTGDPQSIVADRQSLTQKIKSQEELLNNMRSNLAAAQRKHTESLAPGPRSEVAQSIWGGLKMLLTAGYSRPGDVENQLNQVDFDAFYRSAGRHYMATVGINTKKIAESGTVDELSDSLKRKGFEDADNLAQSLRNARKGNPKDVQGTLETELGRDIYRSRRGGRQSLPPEVLMKGLSANERGKLGSNEMFGKEAEAIEKQEAERKKAAATLDELNRQRNPTIDESLLQDANPRAYQKMLIERKRLQRENQLKDAGFAPGSAEYGISNEIARRKTEDVDKGQVAGVMNVSSLHDAIQNMISKNDDARQTAINTREMATTLKQMQERGQYGLTDHPEGPAARLGR